MQLDKLEIERKRWGEDKGRYYGRIRFDNDNGAMKFRLSEEQCERMFEIVADGIIETATDAAKNLTAQLVPRLAEHFDALTERLEAMADENEGHAKRNKHSAEGEKEDGNREAEIRLATRAWMYDKFARKLRALIEEMK